MRSKIARIASIRVAVIAGVGEVVPLGRASPEQPKDSRLLSSSLSLALLVVLRYPHAQATKVPTK